MAPEQVRGEGTTAASDVFAWGCLVAFAATGRPPFGVGAADAILYRVAHGEPAIDGVPVELLPFVERALSKDPSARATSRRLKGAQSLVGAAELPFRTLYHS